MNSEELRIRERARDISAGQLRAHRAEVERSRSHVSDLERRRCISEKSFREACQALRATNPLAPLWSLVQKRTESAAQQSDLVTKQAAASREELHQLLVTERVLARRSELLAGSIGSFYRVKEQQAAEQVVEERVARAARSSAALVDSTSCNGEANFEGIAAQSLDSPREPLRAESQTGSAIALAVVGGCMSNSSERSGTDRQQSNTQSRSQESRPTAGTMQQLADRFGVVVERLAMRSALERHEMRLELRLSNGATLTLELRGAEAAGPISIKLSSSEPLSSVERRRVQQTLRAQLVEQGIPVRSIGFDDDQRV